MGPTDTTKKYVIEKYVAPARVKGEKTIQIRVGNVLKELGWTNRTPSVFSTLSSRAFQRDAGLELIEKRGGPPSGGPSTTVQFVYKILPPGDSENVPRPQAGSVPNGSGLKALYGILTNTFRELGGGEAFLKSERSAWGPDPWERLKQEGRGKDGE